MPAPHKPVVVEPTVHHTATVIWLHGLGDSGVGWLFLAESLAPELPHVKWVFPNAPMRPVTANGDMDLPAWFNVSGYDKSTHLEKVDESGMLASVETVNNLIKAEDEAGISSDRIVVGGFSQGCVISLLTGLTTKHKLAGVIGCSGWLGIGKRLHDVLSDANKGSTPFLVCHGDEDPVVKHRYGQATAKYMNKIGYSTTYKLYPGLDHAASPKELADIAEFLQQQLPNQARESKI